MAPAEFCRVLDDDTLEEALHSAATAGMRYDGPRDVRNHISHADSAVRGFRRRLKRFLADLPGEASIEELRDALATARPANDDEDA